MKKKNLLLFLSLGLFYTSGFTQQVIDNNPKDNFKKQIKEGLDKNEPSNAKSTGVFIPEWRETHMYNQVDEEFDISSKNTYFYQNSNVLVEDLVENYDSNAEEFVPSFRTLYSSGGNWEINLTENWDSGQEIWYESFVDSTEYNMYGDEVYHAQWYYDINAEEWVVSSLSAKDYTYDSNNNIETIVISVDDQTGSLVLDERETYIYDANEVITEAIFEEWDDNLEEWVYDRRGINPVWHDQEEFLISNVDVENWDGNAWQPAMRISMTYHSDNTIEMELEEVWDDVNEVYVNDYLVERDIDANMVETSNIAYDWNPSDEEWNINWGSTFENTYNIDDELEEQEVENWSSFNDEWQMSLKYIYSYKDIASTIELSKVKVNVYPNPAQESIFIESEQKLNTISIVGLNGETVYSTNNINSTNHNVDVNFLAPGAYFVISKSNEAQTSKKLIIK